MVTLLLLCVVMTTPTLALVGVTRKSPMPPMGPPTRRPYTSWTLPPALTTRRPGPACYGVTCLHGGKCINLGTRYVCNCRRGHYGKHCELGNPCTPNSPCQNKGMCIPLRYQMSGRPYMCICFSGHGGVNCEKAKPCSRSACLNGGRCSPDNSERGWRCQCKTGYYGDRCEVESECLHSSPCQNGGRCKMPYSFTRNPKKSYYCDCPSGFSGQDCAEPDPCRATVNPCQNGGLCHSTKLWKDAGWSVYCRCPKYYGGKRCERESPCKKLVCYNGGSCYSYYGSPGRCHCPAKYMGPQCKQERCLLPSKCGNFMPNVTDFETCRAQVEAAIGRRVQCFKRELQNVVKNRSCACNEGEVIQVLIRTPPLIEVISQCLTPQTPPVVAPRCAPETQKCGETMEYVYRNPKVLGSTCNETLRATMERCVKMSDEGRLPLDNCGAYTYLLQQRDQVLRQLMIACAGCNYYRISFTCMDLTPSPLPFSCSRYTPAKVGAMVKCIAEKLKTDEKCKLVSDMAIKLVNWQSKDSLRYIQPGCKQLTKYLAERNKWGCPTAAPATTPPRRG